VVVATTPSNKFTSLEETILPEEIPVLKQESRVREEIDYV
jgi:hypothetical protein